MQTGVDPPRPPRENQRPLNPPPLEWTHHPARQAPIRSLAAGGFIVGFAGLTGAAFGSGFWATLTACVLFVSTSAWWLPTRYRLDDEGAALRRAGGRRFRTWNDLRRLDHAGDSWLLSTLPRPSSLDRIRGLDLRAPPAAAQDLLIQRFHAS